MKIRSVLATVALSLCAGSVVHAADEIDNALRAQEARIEGEYKAQRIECDKYSGNEKDVCLTRSKANRDKALADVRAAGKTADAQRQANREKREADYRVARERCSAEKGDVRDRCMEEAKTAYDL